MKSKEDWEVGWVWIREMRTRGFGDVYEADDLLENRYVAIKKVRMLVDTRYAEGESKILKSCNSEFVVRYYDMIQMEDMIWVMIRGMPHGTDCYGVLSLRLTESISK